MYTRLSRNSISFAKGPAPAGTAGLPRNPASYGRSPGSRARRQAPAGEQAYAYAPAEGIWSEATWPTRAGCSPGGGPKAGNNAPK